MREQLFPQTWRKFVYARGRMLANALQHIHQVIVRIEVVQLARHQQALHDADLFRPHFRPAK